jgi:signal recognition particle GTPase
VGSIDEANKNGEEFLNSLWDGATGGDYEANDWKKFGKDCLEKLEERRDRTKEISEKVFEELAPAFQKRIETDFKTLFNDPEALDRWKEEIRNLLEQINSGIDAQENAIEALASGSYKETATQTMNTVRAMVRVIVDQFTSSSKEVEDEMNKE